MLPKPERVSQVHHAGYLVFFTGLAELINSFLRPDVRSKWAKIDLIMVPAEFFNLHSVSEICYSGKANILKT